MYFLSCEEIKTIIIIIIIIISNRMKFMLLKPTVYAI